MRVKYIANSWEIISTSDTFLVKYRFPVPAFQPDNIFNSTVQNYIIVQTPPLYTPWWSTLLSTIAQLLPSWSVCFSYSKLVYTWIKHIIIHCLYPPFGACHFVWKKACIILSSSGWSSSNLTKTCLLSNKYMASLFHNIHITIVYVCAYIYFLPQTHIFTGNKYNSVYFEYQFLDAFFCIIPTYIY